VALADDGEAFVQACEQLLSETDEQRSQRRAAMAEAVSRYAWDRSADTVHAELTQAVRLARPAVVSAGAAVEGTAAAPVAAVAGLRS
jgi:hypothetical protein